MKMTKPKRAIGGLLFTGLTLVSSTMGIPIIFALMVLLPYAIYFQFGSE